jgi:hypothetical protein
VSFVKPDKEGARLVRRSQLGLVRRPAFALGIDVAVPLALGALYRLSGAVDGRSAASLDAETVTAGSGALPVRDGEGEDGDGR